MADTITTLRIGPKDAGRRVSLEEFASAEFVEGYLYELDKGVVVVADLPGIVHMLIVMVIRDAVGFYRREHPQQLFAVGGGGEAGLQMPELQSQRHPDVAAYVNPPPTEDAVPWDTWIPEIVVEVVSDSSRKRDYEDKPPEYLRAGVRLYWIVDPLKRTAMVLTRRADAWREQKLDETGVLTTGLLPGFALPLAEVFSAIPRPR